MEKIMCPSIVELATELTRLKKFIEDDYIAYEDDLPGMDVTLGCSDKGYALQTGDNSFSGVAYGHRHWGVSRLYRRSNCRELAKELIDQVRELAAL